MFEQQEDFKLEYFSITDADTLEAVESAEDNKKIPGVYCCIRRWRCTPY